MYRMLRFFCFSALWQLTTPGNRAYFIEIILMVFVAILVEEAYLFFRYTTQESAAND